MIHRHVSSQRLEAYKNFASCFFSDGILHYLMNSTEKESTAAASLVASSTVLPSFLQTNLCWMGNSKFIHFILVNGDSVFHLVIITSNSIMKFGLFVVCAEQGLRRNLICPRMDRKRAVERKGD